MATTLIAGLVAVSLVVLATLAIVLRRGRGGNGLLGLGAVSPQWLQSHRQEDL